MVKEGKKYSVKNNNRGEWDPLRPHFDIYIY
jgi:hypothetical protein